MINLERGPALRIMLDMIVQAKRDGMIDHREARELLAECFSVAGAEMVKKDAGSAIRRGA